MLSTLAASSVVAHHFGPAAGFGWLFLLIPLFWIAVIVILASIFGRKRRAMWRAGGWGYGHGHPGMGGWGSAARNAESTLAERFAQGDIDEKEYRARLEVLRANAFPAQPPTS